MKRSTMIFVATGVVVSLASCERGQVQSLDDVDCTTGKSGWKRAQTVSPDVVGICHTGIQGRCGDYSLEYASGTGWCRPKR